MTWSRDCVRRSEQDNGQGEQPNGCMTMASRQPRLVGMRISVANRSGDAKPIYAWLQGTNG
jgi:hypothetical protein